MSERFLFSSPVGLLEIVLAKGGLYSLSRLGRLPKKAFQPFQKEMAKSFKEGPSLRPIRKENSLWLAKKNNTAFVEWAYIHPSISSKAVATPKGLGGYREVKACAAVPAKDLVATSKGLNGHKDSTSPSHSFKAVATPKGLGGYREVKACAAVPAKALIATSKGLNGHRDSTSPSSAFHGARLRPSPLACKIQEELLAYFKGALTHFNIPLARRGTAFQNCLWRKLKNIAYGKTKTYGQLACELGIPKGARAIGQALASNPFLIVIPCHRVVAKSGLGGFALGLKAKKQLLFLEQQKAKQSFIIRNTNLKIYTNRV